MHLTSYLHEKYLLDEAVCVKEYWMVHPLERSLIIFTLNDKGVYEVAKPLTRGDVAVSKAIPGLQIDLDEVFSKLVEEPEEGYGEEVRRL